MNNSGAALLAINNAVNSASRLGMGFVADIAGRQNTLVLSVLGSAITVVAFWLSSAHADDMALWVTFVVTYGIFAGGEHAMTGNDSRGSTYNKSRLQFVVPRDCHRGLWNTGIRISQWVHLLYTRIGGSLGISSWRCSCNRGIPTYCLSCRHLV